MADQDLPIHDIALGTLEEGSLFAMAFPTSGSNFASGKISAAGLGEGICKDMTFSSLLTYDKSVIGAINEMNTVSSQTGYTLTGTLTAGSTTITFTDAIIKEDSIIDVYTDTFGVNPIGNPSIPSGGGSCTLTFEAQSVDVGVRIIVRGVSGGMGGTLSTAHEYSSLSASNDRVRTIWTKTITDDAQLGLHGTGYTDTSHNDGMYVLYKNGIVIESQYLTYNETSAFIFDTISVSTGDVIEIKTDWDNTHTMCRWTLDLFIAEVK